MKFVIIGLGSIGKRHKKNLENLGHQVFPCHKEDNLRKIIIQENPKAVVICNPNSLHLKSATIAAQANRHIFIEKPLSHTLKGVENFLKLINKKNLVLQVGYNLRFEPELNRIKDEIIEKKIGKIISAKIICSSYLPDWRPGTDYRKNYGARKDLGGGVLLDLSHEIDYAVWLFGKVKNIYAKLQQSVELDIETEAIADLTVNFKSGVTATFHLDYTTRGYIRNCQIIGEKGILKWDFAKIKKEWDINQMYVQEMKHFINTINDQEKPIISGKEAKYVLKVIEAAKKSNQLDKIEIVD